MFSCDAIIGAWESWAILSAASGAVALWILSTPRRPARPADPPRLYVACPMMDTTEDAAAWFAKRHAKDVKLWAGPDGLIRGVGRVAS